MIFSISLFGLKHTTSLPLLLPRSTKDKLVSGARARQHTPASGSIKSSRPAFPGDVTSILNVQQQIINE
ncbi:hypothetical protein E2C01_098795 [Portunus trituberculatus]|uniref:Uncharacterized protein n=1 Tax=Portunus trituberculatus TaxID=210409 RepID=A0A5B7K7V5_PORTR|nr:hypothetical protein [Portunus trituberculatus]